MKASDGSLPIHLACLYCGRLGLPVIRYLAFQNPESLQISDGHGLLPKDLVLDNPCPIYVAREISSILINAEKSLAEMKGNHSFECAFSRAPNAYYNFQKTVSRSSSRKLQSKQCVVCMEHDVTRVLNPCGHVCLCDNCSSKSQINKMHERCPECRSKISGVVKFYGRVMNED